MYVVFELGMYGVEFGVFQLVSWKVVDLILVQMVCLDYYVIVVFMIVCVGYFQLVGLCVVEFFVLFLGVFGWIVNCDIDWQFVGNGGNQCDYICYVIVGVFLFFGVYVGFMVIVDFYFQGCYFVFVCVLFWIDCMQVGYFFGFVVVVCVRFVGRFVNCFLIDGCVFNIDYVWIVEIVYLESLGFVGLELLVRVDG